MGCYTPTAGLQDAGVQSPEREEVVLHHPALRHLQDRLGLAHPAVHLLHRHHGALQRRLQQEQGVSVDRRGCRGPLCHW